VKKMPQSLHEGVITFDADLKLEMLSCFDKTVDDSGYIVERDDPSQRVLTPDGENVALDEFAGIRKGSEIFIKADLPSLIKLLDTLE
jgi:hypothetical protein